MTVRLAFLGCLIATAVTPIGAREQERITLQVTPAVCFAPANLVVRTTIVADSDNRSVEIVAESQDFYRSSEVQLDGDRAPRTTRFEFRSLPSGMYEVRAVLRGSTGEERASVRHQVNVIAAGSDGGR